MDQLETDVGLQLCVQPLGCRLQICLVATYRFGNAGHLLWNPASTKQRASHELSNRMAIAPPTTDGDRLASPRPHAPRPALPWRRRICTRESCRTGRAA